MNEIEIVKEIEAIYSEQHKDQDNHFNYDLDSTSSYVDNLEINNAELTENLCIKILKLKHLSSLDLSRCKATDWTFYHSSLI